MLKVTSIFFNFFFKIYCVLLITNIITLVVKIQSLNFMFHMSTNNVKLYKYTIVMKFLIIFDHKLDTSFDRALSWEYMYSVMNSIVS